MKKLLIIIVGAALAAGCCSGPKISVFAHYIEGTSQQRKISLAEAADMIYDLGVRGYDIDAESENFVELAATKLKPINIYFFPKWLQADGDAERCRKCLDRAAEYGVPRIMIVPPEFSGTKSQDEEMSVIIARLADFVAAGKQRGITVTIEDFGFTGNHGFPCNRLANMKKMLDSIPDLRVAIDSGNFYYTGHGDDVLDLLRQYRDRIVHVHLKDQLKENNRQFVTLGLGAVPNRTIVQTMDKTGYDGWYTLENWVGDTYIDTVRQVNVLNAWLEGK